MNITLKNLQVVKRMSEETLCFTATIFIDGQRAGSVNNQGCGGCNFYHFEDRDLEKRFHDFCKSQPPIQFDDMTLDMTADIYIGEIIGKMEVLKEKKRWIKKNAITVFRLNEDTEGFYRIMRVRFTSAVAARLRETHGTNMGEIVNETVAAAD